MIGTQIKNYIYGAGLKYGPVAEKAGIPLNVFSAIINNKRKITVEEYFAICEALGVNIDTFYDLEKNDTLN